LSQEYTRHFDNSKVAWKNERIKGLVGTAVLISATDLNNQCSITMSDYARPAVVNFVTSKYLVPLVASKTPWGDSRLSDYIKTWIMPKYDAASVLAYRARQQTLATCR
jgi:hypothetical protein